MSLEFLKMILKNSLNYINDFRDRVKNIYIPKVKFLKKVIKQQFTLTDIGSGAGHFLRALELQNVESIALSLKHI